MSLNIGQVIDRALRMHGVIADGESPVGERRGGYAGRSQRHEASLVRHADRAADERSGLRRRYERGQAETGGEYSVPGRGGVHGDRAAQSSGRRAIRRRRRRRLISRPTPARSRRNGRLIGAPGGTPTTSTVLSSERPVRALVVPRRHRDLDAGAGLARAHRARSSSPIRSSPTCPTCWRWRSPRSSGRTSPRRWRRAPWRAARRWRAATPAAGLAALDGVIGLAAPAGAQDR